MHRFDYFAPESVGEAVALLQEHAGRARVLAGGTDLIIRMKRGDWVPTVVVNLKRVAGLRGIERRDGGIWIGALTTISDLMRSRLVADSLPILAETAPTMASVQVRNLATVGGNLCNASPSADMAPPLLVLDARVEIAGAGGSRSLPLGDFFTGPGLTSLRAGELVTGFFVPVQEGWRTGYRKLEHREAMDLSVAGVAAAVRPSAGVWEEVRIALGAVAPTPLRALSAEAELKGQEPTEERIAKAAELAAAESRPIDDLRAPAWYRTYLVRVLATRLLSQLAAEGRR